MRGVSVVLVVLLGVAMAFVIPALAQAGSQRPALKHLPPLTLEVRTFGIGGEVVTTLPACHVLGTVPSNTRCHLGETLGRRVSWTPSPRVGTLDRRSWRVAHDTYVGVRIVCGAPATFAICRQRKGFLASGPVLARTEDGARAHVCTYTRSDASLATAV